MAAITAAVSCNSVLQGLPQQPTLKSALVTSSAWEVPFCRKYAQHFDEVRFEVITEQKSYGAQSRAADLGSLQIGQIRAGRVQLHWQSSESQDNVTVWLKVSARRMAWVAKKPLQPGDSIEAADVEHSSANIAPLIGIKDLAVESPVGKTTLKQVRRGQTLTADLIAPPPLIRRSDHIQVTVRSGALQISSPGLALATGWNLGDQIPVIVENAEGPTEAKVIGKGNVYIEI